MNENNFSHTFIEKIKILKTNIIEFFFEFINFYFSKEVFKISFLNPYKNKEKTRETLLIIFFQKIFISTLFSFFIFLSLSIYYKGKISLEDTIIKVLWPTILSFVCLFFFKIKRIYIHIFLTSIFYLFIFIFVYFKKLQTDSLFSFSMTYMFLNTITWIKIKRKDFFVHFCIEILFQIFFISIFYLFLENKKYKDTQEYKKESTVALDDKKLKIVNIQKSYKNSFIPFYILFFLFFTISLIIEKYFKDRKEDKQLFLFFLKKYFKLDIKLSFSELLKESLNYFESCFFLFVIIEKIIFLLFYKKFVILLKNYIKDNHKILVLFLIFFPLPFLFFILIFMKNFIRDFIKRNQT